MSLKRLAIDVSITDGTYPSAEHVEALGEVVAEIEHELESNIDFSLDEKSEFIFDGQPPELSELDPEKIRAWLSLAEYAFTKFKTLFEKRTKERGLDVEIHELPEAPHTDDEE